LKLKVNYTISLDVVVGESARNVTIDPHHI